MSSIIAGYNYDVFISYRQKDNKHDGWVTEFVNNLKGELESAFKEEIGVFFDINPHDGLLETHDVDASLKDKLKCLVFIPIISRTYCDPKSFAWEREFKPFVEMASGDQFGLKVRLHNGNVASRVLPVRIHDLDPSDKKLLESILGGQVRGIEFIYAEPGVNKPLSHDLNPNKYNIQVNKASNAVKELIEGMSIAPLQKDNEHEGASGIRKKKSIKPILWILLLLIIGASTFLLRKQILPSAEVEKSIAVIPFINDSPEAANGFFINGLFDEIINNLQTIKSFSKVVPRASVEKYRKTEKSIPEIAKDLGVNFIISGSGQKSGRSFRLRLTLTDAKNNVLWGHPYEGTIDTNYFGSSWK